MHVPYLSFRPAGFSLNKSFDARRNLGRGCIRSGGTPNPVRHLDYFSDRLLVKYPSF
ncbi:hypothetical protein THIOM_001172 [Candidatus Thiomargarita nelsonii]|uniref:Uncharacterized protein n=1 Tax=Candidatus Thiomargarita nelsonii TaxID=1003181 RepID=A0A176S4L0_9GAMM|nr:hypothetical protein THIOM_001172 [Candidatus Thiomargarita nelsonii]